MAEVQVVLSYKVDKGSAQQVVASNRQVSASIKASGGDIKSAYSGAVVGTFLRRLSLARGEIKGAAKEAQALERELKEASAAARGINIPSAQRSTGGSVSRSVGRLDAVDTGASRASAVLSGLGQGELANLAGLVADLSASAKDALPNIASMGLNLGQMAAAGGIAAVALLAVGVAFAGYQAQLVAAHAAYRAARDAQRELNRLIETGVTTEEAQRQLDALKAAEAGLAQQLAHDTEDLRGAATSVTGPILALTGGLVPLQESVAAGTTALANNQAAQVALTTGIENGVFAANDATAAQEALAEATLEATAAALQRINAGMDREIEFYRLAATSSSEAIAARVEENQIRMALLEDEIALQRQLADQGVAGAAEAAAQLADEYRTLVNDTHRLETETATLVATREKEAQSTQIAARISQNYQQVLQRQAQIQSQIVSTVAQENERRVSLAQQTARAESDFQRQRYLQTLDFNRGLARSDAEFAARRQEQIEAEQSSDIETRGQQFEVIAESNRESLRAAQEHAQNLEDIERDFQDSALDAASNLDARALLQAQRQRDRQLQDANRGYEQERQDRETLTQERLQEIAVEREQRAAAFAQELLDQQTQHETERQQEIDDFNLGLQREDMERAIERQRAAEDEGLRRAAYQQQLNDLRGQLAAEGGLRRSGFAGIVADFTGMISQMRRAITFASTGSNSNAARSLEQAGISTQQLRNLGSNATGTKRFASGGIVPANTRVLGDFERNRSYPEAVIPLTPQGMRNAGMNSNSKTFNVYNTFNDVGSKTNAELESVVYAAMIKVDSAA